MEHRSRTVDKQTDAVRPAIGEISALEHPLVETGAQQQRGVRREVSGIEAGAEPAALVREEQWVELTGDTALSNPPLAGCRLDHLAALRREPSEFDRELADDEFAGLPRRQIDGRRGRDLHQLVGRRIACLIDVGLAALFRTHRLRGLSCLFVSLPIGERRRDDPYRIDAFGDLHLIGLHLTAATDRRFRCGAFGEEPVHASDFDQLKCDPAHRPGVVQIGDQIEERCRIIESEGDVRCDPPLQIIALEVVANEQKAGEGKLAERAGICRGAGNGGPIEIRQN